MGKQIVFKVEQSAVSLVGVRQIVVTEDGVMVITLSDGTVITSPSLKGPKGDTGVPGKIQDVLVNGTSIVDPDGTARFSTIQEDQTVQLQTDVLNVITEKLITEYVSKQYLLDQIQSITLQLQENYAQLDANYKNSVKFVQTFLYSFQEMLIALNQQITYDAEHITVGNSVNFKVTCTNDSFTVTYKGLPYISVNTAGVITVHRIKVLDYIQIGNVVIKNAGAHLFEITDYKE